MTNNITPLTFTVFRKGQKECFLIMKKSKLFKTISFSSLALLMGIAGTMVFAPLGASPSVAGASTVDQINTKADGENIKYAPSALGLDPENDPVIYTTESGLEIKFGGESVTDQLASGQPLAGYPYFTMGTYNGYAVNWVIIGRNTNDTVFTSAITYHLFSSWKTNNGSLSSATFKNNGYSFFKNTFETTTPAGSAINGVVPSKSYVADVTKATKSVVANAEVPQGCVLAYSECVLGTSQFHSTNQNTNYEVSLLKTAMNNRFENLALTTQQKNEIIVKQDLVNNYSKQDNVFETTYSSQQPFWPLGYNHANAPKNENFLIDIYLTSNALRKAYSIGTTSFANYWTRGPSQSCHDICLVEPSGAISVTLNGGNIDTNSTLGVRPACVVKLH